ncbi:MAG: hypothetical protein LBK99_16635 [Opitutaceae bacterium]|jgi:hypothetical protein|nr:hypothetical protein [Opitutaceae bacterium]
MKDADFISRLTELAAQVSRLIDLASLMNSKGWLYQTLPAKRSIEIMHPSGVYFRYRAGQGKGPHFVKLLQSTYGTPAQSAIGIREVGSKFLQHADRRRRAIETVASAQHSVAPRGGINAPDTKKLARFYGRVGFRQTSPMDSQGGIPMRREPHPLS